MVLDHYYAVDQKTKDMKILKDKQEHAKVQLIDAFKDKAFKLIDNFKLFMGSVKERQQAIESVNKIFQKHWI